MFQYHSNCNLILNAIIPLQGAPSIGSVFAPEGNVRWPLQLSRPPLATLQGQQVDRQIRIFECFVHLLV